MPNRRIELPDTVPECHKVILGLHDTLAEVESREAQLQRELYGQRRERFIDDESDVDEADAINEATADDPTTGEVKTGASPEDHPSTADVPNVVLNDVDNEPLLDSDATEPSPQASSADISSESSPSESASAGGSSSDSPQPPRSSNGRRPRLLDPNIPREKVYHPLNPEQVPPEIWSHPDAKRFYRFVREEVELPQRRLRILEHYQEVIVLEDPSTLNTTMVTAAVPEPLLDRCYAGPSLLAYLAVSRFADHLPYYREEDILRRSGLLIHRSTQWRWIRGLSRRLLPLVDLIRQRLLGCQVLGIDETPIPILDPDLAHTRTAYLYAQYGDDTQPYVGYYFAPRKTRANIEPMLTGFQGTLQSDAYICYELITGASLDRIKPAACWAHGRRKFEPLIANGPHPQASWILRRIKELYDIEDRAADMTDQQRLALRQAESRLIAEAIGRWLEQRHQQERPRSLLRKGVNYFRNRWEAFTRFLEDGAIPIDNNRTEAVIKGPVMGKKAWLFLGNEAAGESAAILYTLTMSCRRHCIDPHAYLLDVLTRIRDIEPEDLESLLPDRWIESHPEARLTQRVAESHAAKHRKRSRRAERRRAKAAKL
ncbi:MAG: IS66 family transposase [Planctomycetes bacterium]|nr:IS66 family transposase [Planctomycetota bacterium]